MRPNPLLWCASFLIVAAIPFIRLAEAQSAEALKQQCVEEADLQKRADACTAALEAGALSDGERSFALAMRGGAYIGQAQLGKARKDMEEAQRLSPANPLVVKLMAVLEAAEATQRAYSACREPREPVARLEACDRLLAFVGNKASAQAMAYDLRAHAKAQLGDPVSALSDLDMATKLAPAEPSFQEHKWRALFWVGRYDEALAGLEQLSKRDPSDMELRDAVATSRYVLGDGEAAVALFHAMTTAAPQRDPPSLRAATVQSERDGRAAEAFAELDPTTEWLRTIITYRTSRMTDDAFRQTIASQMPNNAAACLSAFHIGHKAALAQESATAKIALTDAMRICGFRGFEFHAARKWLKGLGG